VHCSAVLAMKFLSVALSAALLARALPQWAVSADNIQLIDCGTDEDAFKLNSIVATPYPPRSGENVTVEASGTVFIPILEGAFVDITVKLGVVKLLTKRVDICEQARNGGELDCPLPEGEYHVKETFEIPGVAPLGRYTIQARGYMSEESEEVDLACADVKLQLLPIRPHFGSS